MTKGSNCPTCGARAKAVSTFDPKLKINRAAGLVLYDGHIIQMKVSEIAVLCEIVNAKGATVNKAEISKSLGYQNIKGNQVPVYIYQIREYFRMIFGRGCNPIEYFEGWHWVGLN